MNKDEILQYLTSLAEDKLDIIGLNAKGSTGELLLSWYLEGVHDTLSILNVWRPITEPPTHSNTVLMKDSDNNYKVGRYVNGKFITKLHNPIEWKEIV